MQRVIGHPNLRKDRNGVIHNIDKDALEAAQIKASNSKCVKKLETEVERLKTLVEDLINGRH